MTPATRTTGLDGRNVGDRRVVTDPTGSTSTSTCAVIASAPQAIDATLAFTSTSVLTHSRHTPPEGIRGTRDIVLCRFVRNSFAARAAGGPHEPVDRSTLADLVYRMQRRRLLQRRRNRDDARAYEVKLTEGGRRVLRTAEPLSNRVDERVLNALPSEQRDRFMEALAAIVERLQDRSSHNTDPRKREVSVRDLASAK